MNPEAMTVSRTHRTPPYPRVFAVIDDVTGLAPLVECAAGWAGIAADRGNAARVRVAALAGRPMPSDATPHQPRDGLCGTALLIAALETARDALEARGLDVDMELLGAEPEGAPQTVALAHAARRWGTRLLIGGPDGAAPLADAAGCPALVLPRAPVGGASRTPPQRVFVASDGSDASADAVREVARIVAPGTAVRVGYVACEPQAGEHPADYDAVVLPAEHTGDDVAHAIVQAALQWRADLLVVGTHGGHPGARWRFASVAAQIARRSPLPLLIVPRATPVASRR
ncbi:universal stress protein family protein [Paraburkholderia caballeronis]|nr:universal stress protein family protein [Paraburkholderia caballeronis]